MEQPNNYVYFMLDPDRNLVKIGRSKLPEARLGALRGRQRPNLELLATICNQDLERELHDRFDHLRVRGEWFEADAELMKYIRWHGTRPDRDGEYAPDLFSRVLLYAIAAATVFMLVSSVAYLYVLDDYELGMRLGAFGMWGLLVLRMAIRRA